MSLCSAFRHRLRSLWHQFFGTIALMEFVLKNPCQQRCSFTLAPCQRSYACPMAQGLETLADLGRTVFRNNRIDEICPEKPVPTALDSHHIAPSQRSSPRAISRGFPSVHPVVASVSLPPRQSELNENHREPKHRRCFWEKQHHYIGKHIRSS